jgi:hypothetical protein
MGACFCFLWTYTHESDDSTDNDSAESLNINSWHNDSNSAESFCYDDDDDCDYYKHPKNRFDPAESILVALKERDQLVYQIFTEYLLYLITNTSMNINNKIGGYISINPIFSTNQMLIDFIDTLYVLNVSYINSMHIMCKIDVIDHKNTMFPNTSFFPIRLDNDGLPLCITHNDFRLKYEKISNEYINCEITLFGQKLLHT